MSSDNWEGRLMMMMYTLIPFRGDPMEKLDFCVRSLEGTKASLGEYLEAIRAALASGEALGPHFALEHYTEAQLREFLRAAERKIAAKLGQ